ncbi:hypothetical protein OG897_31095 [Streptomyces sp. NBC_00237]|uniref:hypothetical protein n=1 Tax=Streptomyces sp. NBC_00237 TaxID=2975687 RepID=UPI002253215F|nr:hypothetical protein [Streptomyces sp. NBC_00237]MCX5205864.1 hypothetical protein [Streptomyces sp. NBC_00237]
MRLGLGWAKSHSITSGQCPVMRYHRALSMAILHECVQIAMAVNATVIPLNEAPRGYAEFDQGASRKCVRRAERRSPGVSPRTSGRVRAARPPPAVRVPRT